VIYLDLIKRFWPFIVGAIAVIALWSWHVSKVNEAEHAGYARAMRAAAAERAVENLKNDRRREVTDRDYQIKVSDLETRVDRLLARHEPAIRMCAGSIEVRIPGPASRADGPEDRGPAEEVGDDLRPRLVSYGQECEATRRQLTALQGWINGLR
jgi:hypothetical protein